MSSSSSNPKFDLDASNQLSIEVRTASRLHVGLLGNADGVRQFGGAGFMVRDPGLKVTLTPLTESPHGRSIESIGPIESIEPIVEGNVEPELLSRARSLAQRLIAGSGVDRAPFRLTLHSRARLHGGLGTGTQLALAVTAAILRWQRRSATPLELAAKSDRGRRSAIGLHGFVEGGFLVDGGRSRPKMGQVDDLVEAPPAPLVARVPFPEDWPVLLLSSPAECGTHGLSEEKAIAGRMQVPESVTEKLCRLLLLGILPGLRERDYSAFAPALTEYNRLVGECFAPAQGGIYASAAIADRVRILNEHGAVAVGQSSWGPTAFGIFPSESAWAEVRSSLEQIARDREWELTATRAANEGASINPIHGEATADVEAAWETHDARS